MREIAHTDPGNLPPFINLTTDGGVVKVSVRSAPKEFDGVAVCKVDCKPGDGVCNNYCAVLRGERSRRPPAMTHLRQGSQASIDLTADVFEDLVRQWLQARQQDEIKPPLEDDAQTA